jgi:hypothetical protein
MDFNLQSYLFMGSVPIIIGLVQVFKLWVKDTRLYPLFSIVLGLAFNIAIGIYTATGIPEAAVMGVIAGLAAAGMYSAATTGK